MLIDALAVASEADAPGRLLKLIRRCQTSEYSANAKVWPNAGA